MNRVSEIRVPPQLPAAPFLGVRAPSPRPEQASPAPASAFGGQDPRSAFGRLTSAGGEHVGNARAGSLGFVACEPASEPASKEFTQAVSPDAPICDFQITASKIHFDQDGSLDRLQLNLDIAHTWRGDLVVQLTSPQGKTVDISNRAGGGADDLKGTVDLSTAFKGETLKGDWILTVMDAGRGDQGTLHGWSLDAKVR